MADYRLVKGPTGKVEGVWLRDSTLAQDRTALVFLLTREGLPEDIRATVAMGGYRVAPNTYDNSGGCFVLWGAMPMPGEAVSLANRQSKPESITQPQPINMGNPPPKDGMHQTRTASNPSVITKGKSIGFLLIAMVGVAVLVVLTNSIWSHPAASIPEVSTAMPVSSSTGPQSGIWNATAEFGDFIFVVNSTGTGVNEYDFGGINIKTSDDEGYPIKDAEFGSMLDFIMIEGKFDSSTTASGTWKYLKQGGSGTWTAIWSHPAASTPEVSTAIPVSSPTSASQPPTPVPTNIAETYLAQFQPTFVELGYGKYSVGQFTFTSGDPGDQVRYGDPIVVHGVEYPYGIFAHAPSRLVYELGNGDFGQLSATLGLVEWISCGDGVKFVVLLDGKEIYRSGILYPWSTPVDIRLPIAQGNKLTLITEDGGNGDNRCDWAIWGDPRLR